MSTPRRLGWFGVVGGLLAQASAYGVAMVGDPADPVVAWLAVVGISATMAGTLVIGALRGDTLSGPARLAAIVLLVVPLVAFAAALLLPAETAIDPLLLGLPRRAAIVLIGVGILPVLVLPLAYARDTSTTSLSTEGLAALRAEAERLRTATRVE
jgi:hypothetical protein